MENGRDDKIRRRALSLWEDAGQRGVVFDYLEAAEADIDAGYEEPPFEAEPSHHRDQPAEAPDAEILPDGTVLAASADEK